MHCVSRLRGLPHGGPALRDAIRGFAAGSGPAQQKKKASLDAKKIVCVASCKGGVGKSSVALNLALALAQKDQAVGLLDMDIYGPSLPSQLPMDDMAIYGNANGQAIPLKWGEDKLPQPLQLMSYGYLKPGEYAAIRGPIVAGLSQQLLTGVAWEGLDTLVIDMPPGTGDVQLTLSQHVSVDGAIMVTTPERLALVDVEKGIQMFDKVGIPTMALVENMAYLNCGSCGSRNSVFGEEGGGKELAERFGIDSYFQLPLDPYLNSALASSRGGPMLVQQGYADRPSVKALQAFADGIAGELDVLAKQREARPTVHSEDRGAVLVIKEGEKPLLRVPARAARLACKCAQCVDEWTGERKLDPAKVPQDVEATKVESAGRYAVHVHWTDMHQSLYPIKVLKDLASA
eukprot:TRINITY_DN42072_c0_g1_i1.p1 TRINITY_DN42072_c0_g1~~TRINITY_DN42072_c0_g1_i1.p1  ORF type:complete len:402 (+),score=79.98 TRINITY_DN42072_c0_g1_i1:113-1318(+)